MKYIAPVSPPVTAVNFKALDQLVLPFSSHLLGTSEDDSFQPYRADDNDKYYVKSITGLEPPGRDVAIAKTASGGKFQGVTTQDREIVVLLGLEPDRAAGETIQMLRQRLYAMLSPGYDPKVDIQLISGSEVFAHEYAYLTKPEASIFDQNPAVQLTFTTLNPTFRAYEQTHYAASSLSETNPNIYNSGTAETGFQFAIKFTGTKTGWSIRQAENASINMTFDYTFHSGDILSVSTIPGNRYVHLKPHRKKIRNLLSALTGDSEWIQLHSGGNRFVVPKKVSLWDWHGPLSFTKQYWGI